MGGTKKPPKKKLASTAPKHPVPSTVPGLVRAVVLNSRAVKLHWSITYAPEHELINGFFIGYRSFEPSPSSGALPARPSPELATGRPADERPTFTYKTIRLAASQPPSAAIGQESANQAAASAADAAQPLLAPVSSKTVGPAEQAKGVGLVQSQFEHAITGLERNTEYTILIQCFNGKGAGPTSDPVVFRTLANGKSLGKVEFLN